MAAQQLGSGFLEPHQVAFTDVAAVGELEIAAEQREGKGVSPDLAARRAQLGVVLGYGRRAGPPDALPVEQPRAVRLIEVAEVVREHPSREVIRGALVFREVTDGLSGGDDAKPRLAGTGERSQERLHAGGAQLAAQRPGGCWSGSRPSRTSRLRRRATASAKSRPLSQGKSAGSCSTPNQRSASLRNGSSEAWRSSLVPWLKKLQL